ncbi:MAG: hypothetical protein IPO56_06160 [Flavobacteriales bacterium]|nr:hypothetical protein [Flavobacteriales bacterium]
MSPATFTTTNPKQGEAAGHGPVAQRLQEGALVWVPDSEVIARIQQMKSDPNTDHGYQKTARRLMLDGYYIGPKKAHRLMQQQDLLAPRRKAAKRPLFLLFM